MAKTTRKKSYHGFETRLETFSGARIAGSKARSRKVTWPHALPSAHAVAKAGFYFTPAQTEYGADLVTCYMCGSGIDGWEPEDDPLKVHAENCSSCPLSVVQSKPWEHGLEHDPHSSTVLGARLQTFYQPLSNDELEEAIVNSTTENVDSNSATISSSALLLMGTSVWPHDSKKGWTPTSERMAKAGFYYWPSQAGEDYGMCAYCGLGLDGWEPNDDPFLEHKQRSPTCIFFKTEVPHDVQEQNVKTSVDISDSEGYESTVSSASTSSKRKKASTAAKRGSKRSSVSEWSDSDASTTSRVKKKRGRPSKKALAEAAAKEKTRTRLSAFEDDSQLFAGAKATSKTVNSTLETFMSPSMKAGQKVPLSKGSVLAKVSKFEGYMEEAAAPKGSKKPKLQKSLSLQVKPDDKKMDVSRSQSVKETEMAKFESSDDDSLLPIMRKPLRLASKQASSNKSTPEAPDTGKNTTSDSKDKTPPRELRSPVVDISPDPSENRPRTPEVGNAVFEQSPIHAEAQSSPFAKDDEIPSSPFISHPVTHTSTPEPQEIPKSPWLSKPEPSPKIFQDSSENSLEVPSKSSPQAWSPSLAPPSKMPLHDTSPQVRNATPPPAIDRDMDPKTQPKTTPVKQISPPQAMKPPNPHQHAHTGDWAGIDADIVFDLLATSGNGFDDSDHASPDKVLLHGQHLGKTVKEWIDMLAVEGEQRLKEKCEALVAILEQEGKRALAVLESLPVRR